MIKTETLPHGALDDVPKDLLIGGRFVGAATGERFDTINPATGAVLASVAKAGAADVDQAVVEARKAFNGPWRSASPLERQQVLLRLAEVVSRRADQLALLDSLDVGLPLSLSKGAVATAAKALFAYSAGARMIRGASIENSVSADMLTYTRKEPVGVVAAITPWNSPVTTVIGKIGPALAAGCTLILKPAEQSPLSALLLAQCCLEAGIPEGVVNVLTGFGDAGAALTSHTGVDKISFTGSVETGQAIIRASAVNLKHLTLELGGKSPDVIFADADMEQAVPGAAMAAFTLTGQFCAAGSRLFIERKIYQEFVERVADFGKRLVVGDPLAAETNLGPIVSDEQLTKVLGYVKKGTDEGADLVSGGSRLTGEVYAGGYYMPPTVFGGVHNGMEIARNEIFGPVVSAIPFDTVEEVLAKSNATQYGLASGVWTKDINKAHWLASRLESGMVWINTYNKYDKSVPFGGYKMSGLGVENGIEGLEQYLKIKSVWINAAAPA